MVKRKNDASTKHIIKHDFQGDKRQNKVKIYIKKYAQKNIMDMERKGEKSVRPNDSVCMSGSLFGFSFTNTEMINSLLHDSFRIFFDVTSASLTKD